MPAVMNIHDRPYCRHRGRGVGQACLPPQRRTHVNRLLQADVEVLEDKRTSTTLYARARI